MKRRESAYGTLQVAPIQEGIEEDKGLQLQISEVKEEMSAYLTAGAGFNSQKGLEDQLREILSRKTYKRLEKERKLSELQATLRQEKAIKHLRGSSEGDYHTVTRLKQRISDVTTAITAENDSFDMLQAAKERLRVQVALLKERLDHLEFAILKTGQRHLIALESSHKAEMVEKAGLLQFAAIKDSFEAKNREFQGKLQRKQGYKAQLSQCTNTSILQFSQIVLSSRYKSEQKSLALTAITQSLPLLTRKIRQREKSFVAWQSNLAYLRR